MGIVKDIPDSERPREKAQRYGVGSLASRELLAIVLRTGSQGQSALETADAILQVSHGLPGLARLSLAELTRIRGIKQVKAVELLACLELARRMTYEEALPANVVENPSSVIRWLKHELGARLQEEFLVVYLDTAHHILTYRILFVGTINLSLVFPREIFREALLLSAASLLLVHNHPSGNLTPSPGDIRLTGRLLKVGRLMEIAILDHLIISETDCFSFRRAGILEENSEEIVPEVLK